MVFGIKLLFCLFILLGIFGFECNVGLKVNKVFFFSSIFIMNLFVYF